MGQDVFVDVAYRGLEVGRRVKLVDVGPRTAYLEHGTPMPVGSGLVIRTDRGLAIPVVVIRVHEQVAGAELAPGMRIRSDALDGDAAGWWRAQLSREEDPAIPEMPVLPMVPMPPPDAALVADEEAPEAAAAPPPPIAKDTRVMDVPELAAVLAEAEASSSGNGASEKRDVTAGATMVMSAVEIEAITGEIPMDGGESGEAADDPTDGDEEATEAAADAPSPPAGDTGGAAGGNGAPGSNGDELRGKRRGRGKRRRR
ncbi:MAG TPA: hypothetical protein VKB80_15385 [Kofleriaceae bacterium]|nr:hypothetical protein [Kofleriaceae bacterium]